MFTINKDNWNVKFVRPNNKELQRSDSSFSVGVTDYNEKTIFLSDLLYGEFLKKVLCHEIVHCYCFSYNVLIPVEQEEWLANFVSDYGEEIIFSMNEIYNRIKLAL